MVKKKIKATIKGVGGVRGASAAGGGAAGGGAVRPWVVGQILPLSTPLSSQAWGDQGGHDF